MDLYSVFGDSDGRLAHCASQCASRAFDVEGTFRAVGPFNERIYLTINSS